MPRADHDALVKEANASKARVAELEAAGQDKEINAAIDQALKDGKITPASADYHREQCRSEGGLDRFKDFVKASPVMGEPSDLEGKDANKSTGKLSDMEKEACRQMGLTEAEFLAASVPENTSPNTSLTISTKAKGSALKKS